MIKNIIFLFLISITLNLFSQEDFTEDSLYIEPIDTNQYYSGFIIQAHSSPFFTTNFFSMPKTRDYTNPIDPEDMYTEYSGYMVGLNLGYTTKDWLVISGINFSKHSANFSVTESKEIIVGNDTTITPITTSSLNDYQNIQIPVSFGYVNYFGNWALTIKAGLFFSINLINDGYTYDFKNKEIVELKDNFSPVLISYSLSASLKYQLSKKLRVFVEPYYISGVNSIWPDSPIYAWKQVHYGAALGIEFLINNKSDDALEIEE